MGEGDRGAVAEDVVEAALAAACARPVKQLLCQGQEEHRGEDEEVP